MASKRTPRRRPVDVEDLATRMQSPDERVRLKALKQACPCRSGFTVYERLRNTVRQLQKDPDPDVRKAALHIVQEACEIEQKQTALDHADDLGLRFGDADWSAAQRRRHATGTWEPL